MLDAIQRGNDFLAERWLSRRRWLRANLQAAGALAAANVGLSYDASAEDKPAAEPSKSGHIDAHVHVWTPNTDRYPLAADYRRDQMKPPSFTPQQLFSHAHPQGVRRITLIQMSFYGFDNSYMLEMMHRHAGVFSGVAVIDEQVKRPQDTMRDLAKQGVRGFRIYPRAKPIDRWLSRPGMAAMWQCGAEEGLAMCHLVNPSALSDIDRMCHKFPRTPVVIDHFSRIGADGVIRPKDVQALCDLAKHKSTSVKVSAFYALGKKKAPYLDLIPMIRRLLDAYGPERLMWASDGPYQVVDGHNYRDSVELVTEKIDFLSDGDRQWLMEKTAEKVFFS